MNILTDKKSKESLCYAILNLFKLCAIAIKPISVVTLSIPEHKTPEAHIVLDIFKDCFYIPASSFTRCAIPCSLESRSLAFF